MFATEPDIPAFVDSRRTRTGRAGGQPPYLEHVLLALSVGAIVACVVLALG